MFATRISPPEIIPLEFGYAHDGEGYDIEGWPHPTGGYNVWITGPDDQAKRIGRVEQPTEVRPLAVDWIESPPEKRFYVGATVRNGNDNHYFVKAIKVSGRLVLWYPYKPTIRNADPTKWEVVEV